MGKKIHLATINAPLFDHAGIKVSRSWVEFDLDKLDDVARQAIETYAGGPKMAAPHRILMVHPADGAVYAEICASNAAAQAKKTAPATPPPMPRQSSKKEQA